MLHCPALPLLIPCEQLLRLRNTLVMLQVPTSASSHSRIQSPSPPLVEVVEDQSAAVDTQSTPSPPASPEPSTWSLLNMFGSPRTRARAINLPTQTSLSLGVYWEQASLDILWPKPGQEPGLVGVRLDRGCLQANKVADTLNVLLGVDAVEVTFRNCLSLHVRSPDRDRSAYLSSSLWGIPR